MTDDVVVHTFTYRLADEKPRAVRGEDVGLRAAQMQVEVCGRKILNLDDLRPRVERRDDGAYVVIENVETGIDHESPFWGTCEYCE